MKGKTDMSTHAIIMQTKDNKTRGIYCHSDGYLDYVGVKLIENYTDETKVEELINLGDLSVLGAEIGHQVDFDDWSAHQLDQCIAYHRDRGEDLNISNIDDVIKWAKDYEYAYLFKNGKWYVYRSGKFQLLSTVLTKKKIKFKSDTPIEKPIKKCETDIVPSDTKHVFEVTCIQDYIEDGDGQDVWNVEEYMKQYPSVFDNPPDIFNYMSQDEFMEYCKKRYPEIKWGYEFIERYWVASDGHNPNN